MSVKNFFKKLDPQEDYDREDDYDAPYGDEAYNDRRDDRRSDDRRSDDRRDDRYDRYDAEDDYYAADTRRDRRDYDRRDDRRDDRRGDDRRDYDRRSDSRYDRPAYDDGDTGAYEEDRYANYRDYDYNSRRDRYQDGGWNGRPSERDAYGEDEPADQPEEKTPEVECFLPMEYAESRRSIIDCLREGNVAVVDVSCLEVEPMTRLTDCLVGAALALELAVYRPEDSTVVVIAPSELELDLAALCAEMASFKADVLSDDDAEDADAEDAE